MKLLKALPLLLLTACATNYQPVSGTGGFSETRLAPNVFRVEFRGNAYTDSGRVEDFAMLRAAEVTLASGFRYFAIAGEQDISSHGAMVLPGQTTAQGSATTFGNTTYASVTTQRTPDQVVGITKPAVTKTIVCFQEQPQGAYAFDAEFLATSIRQKYNILPRADATGKTSRALVADKEPTAEQEHREIEEQREVQPPPPKTPFEAAFRKLESSPAQAVEELKKLATQGDLQSQLWLGDLLISGKNGVNPDPSEGVYWLRRAAEAGSTDAMANLGIAYQTGSGVPKDTTKALEWYTNAANKGNSYAANNLGLMIEKGEGVERNMIKALQWYQRSADLGNESAKQNLERMNKIIESNLR
jgi:hypothetical protein